MRLDEAGIIEGHTTCVNAKRVGAGIAAFVRECDSRFPARQPQTITL